jgi:four helix bundle protein
MANSSMIPSSEIRHFRDLLTWQLAMDLAVDVHRVSLTLPPFEKFELGRQMRRSAVSIPSNVSEGFNRHSQPTYRSHVGIALGSNGELETQLEVAVRLDYLPTAVATRLFDRSENVGRLLQGLWVSLE